jgi:hypothetical protein
VPPAAPPRTEKKALPVKKAAKKASPPVAKEPASSGRPIRLNLIRFVNVPFEKATDHSVGKQGQMRRTTKLLMVLGVVIIFAIVVTGGGKLLKKRQINRRYDRLIADLAVTHALDAQIVLMMQYIKAHPEDAHRSELEARLTKLFAEIEKRDYEKTILDVNRLPIDEVNSRKRHFPCIRRF